MITECILVGFVGIPPLAPEAGEGGGGSTLATLSGRLPFPIINKRTKWQDTDRSYVTKEVGLQQAPVCCHFK